MKILSLIFCFSIFGSLSSQTNTDPEKKWDMKQYYMVFLTKGPNRNQDSTTAANIQKGHMDNMTKMHEAKKLMVAGPFLDDSNMRGIFIFDVASEQEVIDLLNTDPAVIAGRLSYEIHPWMTAKGTCFE